MVDCTYFIYYVSDINVFIHSFIQISRILPGTVSLALLLKTRPPKMHMMVHTQLNEKPTVTSLC